jgi:hypothetical protein
MLPTFDTLVQKLVANARTPIGFLALGVYHTDLG